MLLLLDSGCLLGFSFLFSFSLFIYSCVFYLKSELFGLGMIYCLVCDLGLSCLHIVDGERVNDIWMSELCEAPSSSFMAMIGWKCHGQVLSPVTIDNRVENFWLFYWYLDGFCLFVGTVGGIQRVLDRYASRFFWSFLMSQAFILCFPVLLSLFAWTRGFGCSS